METEGKKVGKRSRKQICVYLNAEQTEEKATFLWMFGDDSSHKEGGGGTAPTAYS